MIVGLILDIVLICLYIGFAIYVYCKNKKQEKDIYEFKTGMNKGYLIFSIVFDSIALILIAISIALYFENTPEGVWVCFGMALFIGVLSNAVLYDNILDYEAIDKDKVIIRRISNKKEVQISDIKSVAISMAQGGILMCLDKDNKKLFMMALQTGKINEFVSLLAKKSIELQSGLVIRFDTYKSYSASEYLKEIGEEVKEIIKEESSIESQKQEEKEDQIYNQLGEEYKKNLPILIRNEKIKFVCIFVFAFLSFVLGSYFLRNTFFLIIMPFVLSGIIKTYLMTKNRLLEEENLRDEELGRTHYYSSSKVVGASQLKKKNAKVGLICFIVLGAVFTIPSFACFFLEPIPQEEMIKVEGTIDYIKLDEDDSDYIAIGINEENEIEYRIYSIYIDEVDELIFEKDGSNSSIILYVDNQEPINHKSEFDENKTKWIDAYIVSIEGKDYLSYEGYRKGFIDDNNIGKFICVFGLVVTIFSIGGLIFVTKYYKKKEQEEHINVYK